MVFIKLMRSVRPHATRRSPAAPRFQSQDIYESLGTSLSIAAVDHVVKCSGVFYA